MSNATVERELDRPVEEEAERRVFRCNGDTRAVFDNHNADP